MLLPCFVPCLGRAYAVLVLVMCCAVVRPFFGDAAASASAAVRVLLWLFVLIFFCFVLVVLYLYCCVVRLCGTRFLLRGLAAEAAGSST